MNRGDLLAALDIPNTVAFLRVIRAGESSQDVIAYRTFWGGSTFDSFADHPRKFFPLANGQRTSAAGAYQITATTWNDLVAQYQFSDFSPATQDQAAVALLARRHALEDVIAGRVNAAVRRLGQEWTSLALPKRIKEAPQIFVQYGGSLASSGDAVPKAPKEVTMAPLVIPILSALSSLIPQLGSLFGGSEVAQRNVAAGSIVANAIVQATNAVNLQDAAERVQNDPQALQAARQAVSDVWPSITEAGSGGIGGARKNLIDSAGIPLSKQPTFILAILFFILAATVVLAALLKFPFIAEITPETRAGVIMFVLGTCVGGVVSFYYGTTQGSQRKTELMGGG